MRIPSFMQKIEFTDAQEEKFIDKVEEQIRQYLWIPVLMGMLFQLYNIIFVLYYTNGTLASAASKVYMGMYLGMCVISLSVLLGFFYCRKKGKKLKRGDLLALQNVYIVFLLLWSTGITLYDQRVSDNITVYLIAMMCIAILVYMPPKFFFPFFIGGEVILVAGLIQFYRGTDSDIYGSCVNSVWMTLIAVFISYYHYFGLRQNFRNHCIISDKNQEIMEKSAELDFLANHDSLTGLLNRRFLASWIASLLQKNAEISMGVFMMDIDLFKNYNDAFGHLKGDECLKRVTNALTLQIENGKLFRYGGEEFLYIFLEMRQAEEGEIANSLCQCIRDLQIEAPQIQGFGGQRIVTISIGSTCGIVRSEADWERLLEKADEALYCAKKGGRNQVVSR